MINIGVLYKCLKDKKVIVTGGATGIGAVIARYFYEQGSQVIILDIKSDAANKLVQTMKAKKELLQPKYFFCDLTNTENISKVFFEAYKEFGPFNVLCNNAADDERHNWEKITSKEWDYCQNINLKSQFFCIREFVKYIENNKGTSIICLGSISYLNGTIEMPSYTTAKSGIVGLVNTMAKILGKKGTRINIIQPGWIMTEKQLSKWVDQDAEDFIDKNQLLKGKIYPEEPAKLALFLASEQSSKITKQIINIDAGWV
tara:strand:+ start:325 stop:1098 length:774 start_codon:yes stop_codon:yes gene_type:complete